MVFDMLVTLLLVYTFVLSALCRRSDPPVATNPPVDVVDLRGGRGLPRQVNSFLFAHNNIRGRYGLDALEWSEEWAKKAEKYGDSCPHAHSDNVLDERRYGENIVAGTQPFTIWSAMNGFMDDAVGYDARIPTPRRISQVLWMGTKQLGCAVSECTDYFGKGITATLFTCLYFPAGNVMDAEQFRLNVPL